MASRVVEANRPILEEVLEHRRRQAATPRLSVVGPLPDRAQDGAHAGARDRLPRRDLPALQDPRQEDYATMRPRLERDTGRDRAASWDMPVLRPRIRTDEHGVDADEVSAYLTLEADFDGLLESAGGLRPRYVEVAEPLAWHPEVRLFEVRDRSRVSGSAGSTLDLHPRPGKFGHAMAWPVGCARRGPDGRRYGGDFGHRRQCPRAIAGQPCPPAPRRRGHALPRVRPRAPRGPRHERLVRHLDGRARGRLPGGRLPDHGELGLAAGHPGARLTPPCDRRADARATGGAPGGQPQRRPRLGVPALVRLLW